MLRRVLALYSRYAAARLAWRGAPRPIHTAQGTPVGFVDALEIRAGRLWVAGWVQAAHVRLVLAGAEAEMAPRQRREDVGQAKNIPPEVGFALDLVLDPAVLQVGVSPGLICRALPEAPDIAPLPLPLTGLRRARARLALRFVWDAVRVSPAVLGWFATHDPKYRARVKAGLGLNTQPGAGPLETALFRTGDPEIDRITTPDPCRITIVLPVYNAFDLLPRVLARLERHTDLPWRLILIEDCSTDARVRPFLQDWVQARAGGQDITLIENPENRGFIRSVNDGLTQAMRHRDGQEGPVVLLNSDAFVPAAWASRLVRPMQIHDAVASVTPMSNDAEIFSCPAICVKTDLAPGQLDAIDAVAHQFHPEALLTEMPTGVGFCMALSRDWLAQVPQLDTAFGRGYGEEVDWCQNVRRLGGRHLALPGLFVEHRGGESFGSAEKRALVARNNEIVASRYPDYDAEVQAFIRADPLVTARLALGLAWAGSHAPGTAVPVYLAHSMGGGAETYLQDRIAAALAKGRPVVVIRVGGARRWQIELNAPGGITRGSTDDTAFMLRLLALLPRKQVIYSCGVGDPDPMSLPEVLCTLSAGAGDRAELLFHDYFPLSPSYTLLDGDGVYRGPVTPTRRDLAHQPIRADGTRGPVADWQAAWRKLALRADSLTVFSQDSAVQVRTVWPNLAGKITVQPHALPHTPPVLHPPDGAAQVIGVLGNIGYQKGAAVLQALAQRLEAVPDARLVLIGNIDPAYSLPKSVPVIGDYRPQDIADLARRHGVSHWLIPSIWPETFSYTTHEVLATGLPVLAFDLGAQGEAVHAAPNGRIIRLPAGGSAPDHPAPARLRGEAGLAAQNVLEALGLSPRGSADTTATEPSR